MSDLISRKALIDTIEKNCYPIRYDRCSVENGMTVTGIVQAINEQPTAFDLEGVIAEMEELAEGLQSDANDFARNADYGNATHFQGMASAYRDIIEFLKSAANATNGKNGG